MNPDRILIRITFILIIAFISSCGKQVAKEKQVPDEVIVPKKNIPLFNGKDLSSFYSWLPKYGHSDPDEVFTVVDNIDGAPAIRISGQHYGGLITKAEYADYKLIAEFKWGSETWDPRKDRARDAGILLHCQGEDGNASENFDSPWLRSVEYQIIEGGTGDIILVDGFNRDVDEAISPKLTVSVAPDQKVWDPEGTPTEFQNGRLNWRYRDPAWKDVLGFRGEKDVEKEVGKWNLIEVIAEGGNFVYFLNGVKVNEGKNGSFKEGKLLFQSEGAELFFRRIELQPT
jgi:hypothetical protein